jgi:putative transposase
VDNYGFIHRLKGTSLAHVSDRRGEELQQDSCITLPELERLIHVWIVDVHNQRPHAGVDGRTPSAVWAESAEVHHPPRRKVDVDTLDVELSEVDERSLGRGGIEINNNLYTSARLCMLRRMLRTVHALPVRHERRGKAPDKLCMSEWRVRFAKQSG